MDDGESRLSTRSTKVPDVLFEVQDFYVEHIPLSDGIIQLPPEFVYCVLNVALGHRTTYYTTGVIRDYYIYLLHVNVQKEESSNYFISKPPTVSTWKRFPGGITVVALYSATMAGPAYFLPGTNSSRA